MNDSFPEFDEFQTLLSGLCDESLTPEQMRRFEALLLGHPQAEAYYVQFMSLHAELHRRFSVQAAKAEQLLRERARSSATAMIPIRRRTFWTGLAMTAVAAAVIIALLLRQGSQGPTIASGPPPEPTDDSVAVLLQSPGATWDDSGSLLRAGAPLYPGKISLKSGHAQIEFYSGARVILEGPAEFELISRTEAFCRRGKLRAIVPPHAQGFTVNTPTMNLVDRGTEFGVDVGADDKTEVHVFQGKVELYDPTSEKPGMRKELTTGQGIHMDTAGKLESIKPRPEAFLTAEQVARQAQEAIRKQRKSWLAASEEIRKDPSLLVYYSFETSETWSRTLVDKARSGKETRDGAIVGCAWGPGRWPGKRGLEFKRVSDRVRVNVPGEFISLTLMAWVRVDALPNGNNSLFMADGWEPGETHWQIGNDGKMILGVQCNPKGKGSHYHAYDVLTPSRFGQWIHLAVAYDEDQGKVTHFVDGKVFTQEPVQIEGPLAIGDAELGNWNVATHQNSTPIRNLNGCMDEFLLFSRALSAEEVERLYLSGRPPS